MIRVFVGCAADGSDCESQAVLEYTLRAHASEPVDLTWLTADKGWRTERWGTPFSGLRWSIPAMCEFEGRAIYLDSDMLLRGDIAGIWRQPSPAGAFALVRGGGRKVRTCVMVLDCAKAKAVLPDLSAIKADPTSHETIMARIGDNPSLTGQIDGAWNVVDLKGWSIDDPAIRLIHYSSIAHQPHLRHAVKRLKASGRKHWYDGERFAHWRPELTALFDRLLNEAAEHGYTPDRYEPAKPYKPTIRSYVGVRVKGFSA